MKTIERNYRRNPHTANFLMTFHEAAKGLPADLDDDLLNSIPETEPETAPAAYTPSPAQVDLICKLILEVHALDAELGSKAGSYTTAMDRNSAWTRENTSRWIGNLIKKSRELTEAARKTTSVQVADGRYAVEHEGTLKFYKVTNGRRPGFVFLDVQASDDWHSIRNLGTIRQVLALIAIDAKAAMIRYGQELGRCGHCGRTLTDETSRAAGIGPTCANR
jgi:hypothetical protein